MELGVDKDPSHWPSATQWISTEHKNWTIPLQGVMVIVIVLTVAFVVDKHRTEVHLRNGICWHDGIFFFTPSINLTFKWIRKCQAKNSHTLPMLEKKEGEDVKRWEKCANWNLTAEWLRMCGEPVWTVNVSQTTMTVKTYCCCGDIPRFDKPEFSIKVKTRGTSVSSACSEQLHSVL